MKFQGVDVDTRGLCHFDEVAVQRLLSGKATSGQAHEVDRDAAILILLRHGLTEHAIAGRLRSSAETVQAVVRRDRARQERLADRLVIPEVPEVLRWVS